MNAYECLSQINIALHILKVHYVNKIMDNPKSKEMLLNQNKTCVLLQIYFTELLVFTPTKFAPNQILTPQEVCILLH